MSDAYTRIPVIVGPTASGKSKYAVDLALANIDKKPEIISADARQVFVDFNIGTGKTTHEEMQDIPHHGIDIAKPTEPFTVYHWQRFARKTIADIIARGGWPIIVGGTGLYISALVHNYNLMPEPELPEHQKQQLKNASHDELLVWLREATEKHNLPTPNTTLNNPRRIQRAIEKIWLSEKTPPSVSPSSSNNSYTITFLNPPRESLREQIAKRVQTFFDTGLVEETKQLLEKYPRTVAPFNGIGYKESIAYLDNTYDLETAVQKTVTATHQYAKRQVTWFKNMKQPTLIETE